MQAPSGGSQGQGRQTADHLHFAAQKRRTHFMEGAPFLIYNFRKLFVLSCALQGKGGCPTVVISSSNFYKAFRGYYHTSPREYR